MIDTDLENDVGSRLIMEAGSSSSVRTTIVPGNGVDRSVQVVAPPRLLRDLWRNLALLLNSMPLFKVFVRRSIALRHTQSFLGVVWLTIQPVASTLTVLFMFNIIQVNTADGANKGLFLFSGIMVWQFFARGLTDATSSLHAHAGILTKVYLPKLMLPLASVAAAWFETLITIALLILACFVFGIPLSPRVLWLPIFLTIVCLSSLCIGIGLAPLHALYRDVGMMVPFALQLAMFISPVYYATRFIPEKYQLLYHLNPMVTLIEGVRWSLLPESPAPELGYIIINLVSIVLMFGVSLFIYQKLESLVVDRI